MDSPQSPDDDRCRAPERDAFPMAIPATSSAQTGNCPPEWSWAKWGPAQRSIYLRPRIVKAWTAAEGTVVTGNMTHRDATWPELPLSAWKDTYATLHLWTQIIGKIRLAQTPWLNHSWHVVLYVSARGLTTSAIPYGDRSFQLDFDFLDLPEWHP